MLPQLHMQNKLHFQFTIFNMLTHIKLYNLIWGGLEFFCAENRKAIILIPKLSIGQVQGVSQDLKIACQKK